MKKTQKKNVRKIVQVFFLILIALISINHTLAESGREIPFLSQASIHGICPFGGVVTLYNLATVGDFIQKIHSSAVILMALVFLLAVLFGPVFCGWVCPLGTVQEWIGKIGQRVFKRRYNHFLPLSVEKIGGFFRYGVLLWVVYVTARSGTLIFQSVDPYYALFSFWSGEVAIPALVILGATLIGSLFVERPWCKFLCPYGALLGLSNKLRLFPVKRNPETCISCGKCDRACPMNIPVEDGEQVKDARCISCYECTSERECPVADTVTVGKKIPVVFVGLLIGLILFGGIGATAAMNLWTTTSEKTPNRFEEGVSQGEYDPADIRGSYTFEDVAELFDIDSKMLVEAFLIENNSDGGAVKIGVLEEMYPEMEIGNESVQTFVALLKGLPYELGDAMLPKGAVDLLLESGASLSEAQKEWLSVHQIDLNGMEITPPPVESEENSDPGVDKEEKELVTGNTTFQQLLDSGINKDQMEEVLGGNDYRTNQTVKDYCEEKGLTFSVIKEEIGNLIP